MMTRKMMHLHLASSKRSDEWLRSQFPTKHETACSQGRFMIILCQIPNTCILVLYRNQNLTTVQLSTLFDCDKNKSRKTKVVHFLGLKVCVGSITNLSIWSKTSETPGNTWEHLRTSLRILLWNIYGWREDDEKMMVYGLLVWRWCTIAADCHDNFNCKTKS
jgi:hypothetical protein